MSFIDYITIDKSIYIIPRGAKDISNVVQVKSRRASAFLEVFFSHDKYQVISDKTLKERECTLEEYIENTESWRKD